MMTPLLETAIDKMKQLSAAEQDAIAQRILEEVADEQDWDKAFAESQEALVRLAAKVRADIKAGKVLHMGIDEL